MKQQRKFRFGVTCNGALTQESWLNLARKVESQGYSTLLISDHLHNTFGPISALLYAADVTTSLRVGSYVFDNDFRHPVFLAQEAATIDLLSNGRLELGLGAGWLLGDYKKSGLAFDPPSVRVSRLQEAIHVMKGLWAEGQFTYSGAHYQIENIVGLPKPVQKPYPPILIGGGSQRVLAFAAQEADIVGINFKATREGSADLESIRPEAIDQKVQWIREAAGDRFDTLELNNYAFITSITDRPRQVARESLARFGVQIEESDIDDWLDSPMVLVGTIDQITEKLCIRRERFGISYVVIRDSVSDEFAPVVERLADT